MIGVFEEAVFSLYVVFLFLCDVVLIRVVPLQSSKAAMKGRMQVAFLFLACSYCHGMTTLKQEGKFLVLLIPHSTCKRIILAYLIRQR